MLYHRNPDISSASPCSHEIQAATTHKNSPKIDEMLWLDHTLNLEMESVVLVSLRGTQS